jgi:hypothetical protein
VALSQIRYSKNGVGSWVLRNQDSLYDRCGNMYSNYYFTLALEELI